MIKKNQIIISLLFLLLSSVSYADIADWECYGSTSIDWVIKAGEQVHSGTYAAKMSDPATSTYKILYQSVAINPAKSYTAEVWVYNINYTNSDYVKLRFGMHIDDGWTGNSFKNYQDLNTTTTNSWVKLRISNVPANGTNNYAKIGLYVHYPSAGSYIAYWDDARIFATDNTNVNLLSNPGFESSSSSSGGGSDDLSDMKHTPGESKIELNRKIFSPRDYEKVKIDFAIPHKNSALLIRVYNTKGILIRDIYNTEMLGSDYGSRTGTVYWDGKNDYGSIVNVGAYIIFIEASNKYTGSVTKLKTMVFVGRTLK